MSEPTAERHFPRLRAVVNRAHGRWHRSRDRRHRALERVVWGGDRRERMLERVLAGHYDSVLRRQWRYCDEHPHWYDHRIGAFRLALGSDAPFPYYRGFFAAELVRPGDAVLDVGCGDGFFAHRFFSPLADRVDALDVDTSAIEFARAHHAAANVNHHLLDAVRDPFPGSRYDLVVWDGALGHFAASDTATVLDKITAVLAEDGAFAGSETLGDAGHDHLQFFADVDALRDVLSPRFRHVRLCEVRYPIASGELRREAFWRCADDPARLDAAGWR